MSPAGAYRLRARWQEGRIRAVDIGGSRPRLAALFAGQTPALVGAALPRLYALCRVAQGAAAELALAAAAGQELPETRRHELARGVAAEALRENLWRLLLDWPALFGLEARREACAPCFRQLAAPPAPAALPALGARVREALGLEEDGAARPGGLAAQLLQCAAALPADGGEGAAAGAGEALRPVGGDAAAWARLLGWPGAAALSAGESAALPAACAQGLPACAADPRVARHWQAGRRVAARLQGRLLDITKRLAQLGAEGHGDGLSVHAAGDGTSLSVVETARGPLLHEARLVQGRVQAYVVCAPTDWNFHARGAFALEAIHVAAHNESAALLALRALALSLDPCVEHTVELMSQGARHA